MFYFRLLTGFVPITKIKRELPKAVCGFNLVRIRNLLDVNIITPLSDIPWKHLAYVMSDVFLFNLLRVIIYR